MSGLCTANLSQSPWSKGKWSLPCGRLTLNRFPSLSRQMCDSSPEATRHHMSPRWLRQQDCDHTYCFCQVPTCGRLSNAVLPPVPALGTIEEQGHAFFCAGREENRLIVLAHLASHIPGPGEGWICSNILQDDCLLLRGMSDLIPAQVGLTFEGEFYWPGKHDLVVCVSSKSVSPTPDGGCALPK